MARGAAVLRLSAMAGTSDGGSGVSIRPAGRSWQSEGDGRDGGAPPSFSRRTGRNLDCKPAFRRQLEQEDLPMHAKLIVTGISVAALLGACTTTDPYSSTPRRNNTATGALAGALGGAVLGYLTNTSNSEEGRKNALIGAGIGALGGG